ncbi:MAG: hypothetical protein ACYC9Q_11455 [Bacillota bacterium]
MVTLGLGNFVMADTMIVSGLADFRYLAGYVVWGAVFVVVNLAARRRGARGAKLHLSGIIVWVIATIAYYSAKGFVEYQYGMYWRHVIWDAMVWIFVSIVLGLVGSWVIEAGSWVLEHRRHGAIARPGTDRERP